MDISDRLLRTGTAMGTPTCWRTGRDANGNRPLTGSLEHHNLTSQVNKYILGGPTGDVSDTIDVWAGGATLTNRQREPYEARFKRAFANEKTSSGAFVDRQQAILIAMYLLNSTDGMAQLDLLDNGSEQRVKLESAAPATLRGNAVMVYYAGTRAGDSDISTQRPISSAVMIVDLLIPGEIHIQTFFPVV
ncbi:hypothetical protein [Pseudomonas sp. ME-P-057]|uniref:hypothetical protein n=1 Tax=Pseudomonas sp. ME-P-057 TaxID=3040321 RepID=UPI00255377B6|nr:hypothetical protein [Pseudomonas sp. ME-P-057]